MGLHVYMVVDLLRHSDFVRAQADSSVETKRKPYVSMRKPTTAHKPDVLTPSPSPGVTRKQSEAEKEAASGHHSRTEVFFVDKGTDGTWWGNLDFEDRTTRTLRLAAHGTLCRCATALAARLARSCLRSMGPVCPQADRGRL